MYRRYQNRAKRRALQKALVWAMAHTLAAGGARRKRLCWSEAVPPLSAGDIISRSRKADTAHESRFGGPMCDHADHYIGPRTWVLDREVIAVGAMSRCPQC
jgi:hypothetical protein